METIEKPKSAISASSVHKLCPSDKSKTKTCQSYVLELAMREIGINKKIETAEMRHGITNQLNAFEFAVKPLFADSIWYDQYIAIDNRCGASPDVLIGDVPLDVKCPSSPFNFYCNVRSVKRAYVYQLQMQMIATGANTSYLLFYCTKPETFGMEDWQEFPIKLERRVKLLELPKDSLIQDEIMQAVDNWHSKKIEMIEMLKSAEIIDYDRFFFDLEIGVEYRYLSDASNIFNVKSIYRLENEFFYTLNK
jgi:hypothetical protein